MVFVISRRRAGVPRRASPHGRPGPHRPDRAATTKAGARPPNYAIVNPPQAAILAVGRISDRVVALNGQPAVQPTMVLTLSCDHRALDGTRGAQFLGAPADLIEEPLALLG